MAQVGKPTTPREDQCCHRSEPERYDHAHFVFAQVSLVHNIGIPLMLQCERARAVFFEVDNFLIIGNASVQQDRMATT